MSGARQTTIKWLRRTPDFWEAAMELPEWERLVLKASSMDALCERFT